MNLVLFGLVRLLLPENPRSTQAVWFVRTPGPPRFAHAVGPGNIRVRPRGMVRENPRSTQAVWFVRTPGSPRWHSKDLLGALQGIPQGAEVGPESDLEA